MGTGHSGAVDRALSHLDVDPASIRRRDGYLDLIGDDEPTSTGFAQDLMLTRIVPSIYERWWRPVLARIAKGPAGPSMAQERDIAIDLLGLVTGDVVVDVACGPGNFTRAFADVVGEAGLAMGIDVSPTMLARAVNQTDAGKVVYVRANATRVPLREASVDAVCCFAALHLFPDPWRALAAMTRSLVRGGRVAVLTSYRPSGLVGTGVELGARISGMQAFGAGELTGALTEQGLEIVDHRTHGLLQVVGARKPGDG